MTKKTAPAAPVLIVGASAIDKAILSIKGRGAKLDSDIQLAGLSVIQHLDGCGDTTLCDRLFNAMPKGARRNALAEWLVAFGKMRVLSNKVKEEALALKAGRVFQFDKTRSTDLLGAQNKPWYECKKEAAVSDVFDVQAAFASLIARVKSAQSEGKSLQNIAQAEALIAELTSIVHAAQAPEQVPE